MRLHEDVIVSHRAASTGGQSSLNYLPGSTFLGAVANVLYSRLNADEQHTIFHSDKVRFSDALPIPDTSTDLCYPGYPMPLCWHHDKGTSEDDFQAIYNLLDSTCS